MYYIVGLGNPGEKYSNTRHNVGWLALDYFLVENQLPALVSSKQFSGEVTEGVVAGGEVKVLYPDTYMNNSGSAVVKFVPKDDISKLIVVHDDIDLPFGEVKIGKGKGAGGNNGVQSIIDKLGTKEFVRVRVGIAPKSIWTGKVKRPQGGGPLERFVLKPFGLTEKGDLPEVYKKVQLALETIILDGAKVAMNRVNQTK
ncbi:aminoacyl-tRNA hydrolase [Candidatus Nomurabacteria bacterium]|nr:aminoacyl-tRNA hydrolase [Candidatus Kaiserbacteria bacterium]MCB9815309.1 aminoacyl-tRNA hydrolase [Candidatus Nomurabacteria bacterium]